MMRQIKIKTVAAVLCGVLLSHAVLHAQSPGALTVSAAISLKNAFDEMGKIFEAQHSGTKIQFNYGASGDLKKQIEGRSMCSPPHPQKRWTNCLPKTCC